MALGSKENEQVQAMKDGYNKLEEHGVETNNGVHYDHAQSRDKTQDNFSCSLD